MIHSNTTFLAPPPLAEISRCVGINLITCSVDRNVMSSSENVHRQMMLYPHQCQPLRASWGEIPKPPKVDMYGPLCVHQEGLLLW